MYLFAFLFLNTTYYIKTEKDQIKTEASINYENGKDGNSTNKNIECMKQHIFIINNK